MAMGLTACVTMPAAELGGAADNGELRDEETQAAGEAQCAYTTAHALACTALEEWKAANPWWNTVRIRVTLSCIGLPK